MIENLYILEHGNHFIYGLFDSRDGEVRYVGRTRKPKKRLAAHLRFDGEGGPETDKDMWIDEVIRGGGAVHMRLLCAINDHYIVGFLEVLYARYFTLNGTNLVNGAETFQIDKVKAADEVVLQYGDDLQEMVKQAERLWTKRFAPSYLSGNRW